VNLNFPSDAKAKEAKTALDKGLEQVKKFLPLIKLQFALGPQAKEMGQALDQAQKSLDSITVVQSGGNVALGMKAEMGSSALGAGLLLPAIQKVREAATRTQSNNNLKQLILALHNYHDQHGHFPPPVIYSKDGKRPLYSWRVELLPYVEQQQLSNEFHKDEPWDSPHNKQLLSRMPKVFALPGRERPGLTTTCYQLITGPRTPFPTDKTAPRLTSFTDGTSNTLLVVEGAREVNWSQPEDLKLPATGSVKQLLGGHFGDSFQAALADGSVYNVKKTVSDQTLRSAIDPKDGKRLGPDWQAATK
jgi:hypothetical protein